MLRADFVRRIEAQQRMSSIDFFLRTALFFIA